MLSGRDGASAQQDSVIALDDAADDIARIVVEDLAVGSTDIAFAVIALGYGKAHRRAAVGAETHGFLHAPTVAEFRRASTGISGWTIGTVTLWIGLIAARIFLMAENMPEIKLDTDNMYREETYTDLKVGSIRRMIPVTAEGDDDSSRSVRYEGQASLMTPAGNLPLSFELEVDNL